MTLTLIGTIILMELALVACVIVCIKSIQSLTESQNSSKEKILNDLIASSQVDREWWAHQLQIALNRSQFPETANMQSAMSAAKAPELAEVSYTGEDYDQIEEERLRGAA